MFLPLLLLFLKNRTFGPAFFGGSVRRGSQPPPAAWLPYWLATGPLPHLLPRVINNDRFCNNVNLVCGHTETGIMFLPFVTPGHQQ
jgi:hypothetical protein